MLLRRRRKNKGARVPILVASVQKWTDGTARIGLNESIAAKLVFAFSPASCRAFRFCCPDLPERLSQSGQNPVSILGLALVCGTGPMRIASPRGPQAVIGDENAGRAPAPLKSGAAPCNEAISDDFNAEHHPSLSAKHALEVRRVADRTAPCERHRPPKPALIVSFPTTISGDGSWAQIESAPVDPAVTLPPCYLKPMELGPLSVRIWLEFHWNIFGWGLEY